MVGWDRLGPLRPHPSQRLVQRSPGGQRRDGRSSSYDTCTSFVLHFLRLVAPVRPRNRGLETGKVGNQAWTKVLSTGEGVSVMHCTCSFPLGSGRDLGKVSWSRIQDRGEVVPWYPPHCHLLFREVALALKQGMAVPFSCNRLNCIFSTKDCYTFKNKWTCTVVSASNLVFFILIDLYGKLLICVNINYALCQIVSYLM